MADEPAPYQQSRVSKPMPPSIRRGYKGQSRVPKLDRQAKGIPPWKVRQGRRG